MTISPVTKIIIGLAIALLVFILVGTIINKPEPLPPQKTNADCIREFNAELALMEEYSLDTFMQGVENCNTLYPKK